MSFVKFCINTFQSFYQHNNFGTFTRCILLRKLRRHPLRLWILQVCETVSLIVPPSCLSGNIIRISRLFIDAKKILLYTQNDRSYEGYKGLLRALRKLQKNTARKNISLICLFCVVLSFLIDQLINQFSHLPIQIDHLLINFACLYAHSKTKENSYTNFTCRCDLTVSVSHIHSLFTHCWTSASWKCRFKKTYCFPDMLFNPLLKTLSLPKICGDLRNIVFGWQTVTTAKIPIS